MIRRYTETKIIRHSEREATYTVRKTWYFFHWRIWEHITAHFYKRGDHGVRWWLIGEPGQYNIPATPAQCSALEAASVKLD